MIVKTIIMLIIIMIIISNPGPPLSNYHLESAPKNGPMDNQSEVGAPPTQCQGQNDLVIASTHCSSSLFSKKYLNVDVDKIK